jgi:hypothetical protein
MMALGRPLPKDIVDSWPEVFGEVNLQVLPIRYLYAILVNFKDGTTWEIKLTNEIKDGGWDSFEKMITELHKSYEQSIENIDFKLDTSKVKKDILKSTNKFLKKRKL